MGAPEILSRYDGSLSRDVAALTPEYRVGECYAASAMGLFRWMDALSTSDSETDSERYGNYLCNGIEYCQGWHLRLWKQEEAIDGFAHGFLVDRTGDEPVVVDPLRHRYVTGYDAFWVPVQRWTAPRLDRRFEAIDDGRLEGMWPLTMSSTRGTVHLEHRLGFQRAYDLAVNAITAEVA